ncbi:MAG: DnaA/Hda family protein [Deltaproteobacteria bacterium]|nr:DnaA/Hda family protein [Deltaproteobacteria bacterium]
MKQIALALYDPDECSFSDIVSHSGIANSIQMLLATFLSEPNEAVPAFLYGPSGSGKTLILKALQGFLTSQNMKHLGKCIFLPVTNNSHDSPNLESIVDMNHEQLVKYGAVLIDDVDKLSGIDAKHLWNLWNKLLTTGAHLVCSSSVGPDRIFSDDPHLRSRMISGLSVELLPPDDAARILILDRMATKRGIRLTHDVISYLLSRKSRNLKRLEEILKILDMVSMEERRRVTLRLVKQIEGEGII